MEKLSSFEDKKSELQIDGSKIFEEEVQLQELDNIERQIEQIRKMEGINSISISHLWINATNLCNILSNNQSKLLFLERAIKLSEYDDEASMLAYINLSSYYRKIGEYKQAATYLEKSLWISVRLNKDDSRVDTHLSLGTVYSQLGRHDFAKRHIQSAIVNFITK